MAPRCGRDLSKNWNELVNRPLNWLSKIYTGYPCHYPYRLLQISTNHCFPLPKKKKTLRIRIANRPVCHHKGAAPHPVPNWIQQMTRHWMPASHRIMSRISLSLTLSIVPIIIVVSIWPITSSNGHLTIPIHNSHTFIIIRINMLQPNSVVTLLSTI